MSAHGLLMANLGAAAGPWRALDLALVDYARRVEPAAPDSVLLALALASRQMGQGHLCVALPDVLATPARYGLPDDLALPSLSRWRQQLAASHLVAEADVAAAAGADSPAAATPLVLDGDSLYLRRAWRDECAVAADLRARLALPPLPRCADEQLRGWLDTLFAAAATPGTDWQKVACALALHERFSVITGGPGTGKTTTVLRLLALLQWQALALGEPLRIRLAAPTGKAAARLNAVLAGALDALPVPPDVRAAIPAEVVTVHRLLGAAGDRRAFRHHAGFLLPLDVLVIDEASMLDLELMAALLSALPRTARLILLGDKDQLASVEAGAVLGDLCAQADQPGYGAALSDWLQRVSGEDVSAWRLPDGRTPVCPQQQVVMLRHSHRFDAGRGIGRLAKAVRDGDSRCLAALAEFAPEVQRLAQTQLAAGYAGYAEVIQSAPADDCAPAERDAWAARALTALDDYRILCAVREGPQGVQQINEDMAGHWQALGLRSAGQHWYAGRPVMVTRNDAALGLMNGDVGVTLWQPDADAPGGRRWRVVFRRADGSLRWLLPARLPALETVFAMTVHKAQGSEFAHAALVLPAHPLPVLTRELIYTAVTRARSRFSLCLPADAVWQQALSGRALRASGLARRLKIT